MQHISIHISTVVVKLPYGIALIDSTCTCLDLSVAGVGLSGKTRMSFVLPCVVQCQVCATPVSFKLCPVPCLCPLPMSFCLDCGFVVRLAIFVNQFVPVLLDLVLYCLHMHSSVSIGCVMQ